MVDKVEGGKEVGGKWLFKMKRLADGNIDNVKAQLVVQDFMQHAGLNFDEHYTPIVCFDSLWLLLAIRAIQGWRLQHMD
jgi:hypothetical protein